MPRFALISAMVLLSLLLRCRPAQPEKATTAVFTPVADTSFYLPVHAGRLFVEVKGQGTPVLVLHGGPGMNARYFEPHLSRLLADSLQLVFFDQRNAGKSDAVTDTTALGMDDWVADIEAIRVAFGWEKVRLLAHSWGCVPALWYARTHPDKVEGLILAGSTGPGSQNNSKASELVRERMGDKFFEELYFITQSPAFQRGNPPALDNYYRTLFRASFRTPALADSLRLEFGPDFLARSRMLGYLSRDLNFFDFTPDLPKFTFPVLVLHGDYDLTPAAQVEAMANALPNGRFVLLPDCGHFAFIEAPEAFQREVLAFWRRGIKFPFIGQL